MQRLSDIGEDALVGNIIDQISGYDESVIVGPGDDCAVMEVGRDDVYQLLKTDAVVEGVHYLKSALPNEVGWKAAARVISDFAAMGGSPSQLLVTIAMPKNTEVADIRSLYEGLNLCAESHGASIIGGETTTVPEGSSAMISVSGTGWVKKNQLVTRSGGEVGDVILVTGKLGGSIKGKHLNFNPRLKEALWLVEHFKISAMMDLSDGLARDLPRLAKASGCGFSIEEVQIPCNEGCDFKQAVGDGEDYELLLTIPSSSLKELSSEWAKQFPGLSLSAIGELTSESGGCSMSESGWEHFTSS